LSAAMNNSLANSLEALANLHYLIRRSLHDPAAAAIHIDLAEARVRSIVTQLTAAPDFVCPVCGAQPREWCEMNDGALRFESHRERWVIQPA
jgi:hypothetical protein